MAATIRSSLVVITTMVLVTVVIQLYLASQSETVVTNTYHQRQELLLKGTVIANRLRDNYRRKRDKDTKREEHVKTLTDTKGTGKINVHIWESICSPKVNSLRQYPLFPSLPNKRLFLSTLIAGSRGTWYGQRIMGFLHPPQTGKYVFSIKAHRFGELWLSNSSDPRHAALIAKEARPSLQKRNVYDNQITKKSREIKFQKDQKYYIDVLHVANGGGFDRDHVKIEWRKPQCAEFETVNGKFLSPLINDINSQQRKPADLNELLTLSPATVDSEVNDKDVGEDDEDYDDVSVPAKTEAKYAKILGKEVRVMKEFTHLDFSILFSFIHNGRFKGRSHKLTPFLSEVLLKFFKNFENNTTRKTTMKLSPLFSDSIPKYFTTVKLSGPVPTCEYNPSYVRPGKELKKYEGIWVTHYSSVFPDDGTSAFFCLGNKQKADCNGNDVLKQREVIEIVEQVLKMLTSSHKRQYHFVSIINVEKNRDPLRGARYFIELILQDRISSKYVLISDYVYRYHGNSTLCKPKNITWNSDVVVNIVLTVKNQGVWAQHFINELSRIVEETRDQSINVIVVDYNSTDIDIEKALQRSSITQYRVLRRSGQFHKTEAIQSAVHTVNDSHSIVLLFDLHMRMPNSLIDSVRKHTIEGRICFTPVLFRLSFCGRPSNSGNIAARRGFWETFGFGIIGIYKSDWNRFGGMDTQHFKDKWGGEDWEMIDRLIATGLEVERLRIPGFYHFHHPKTGMWDKSH